MPKFSSASRIIGDEIEVIYGPSNITKAILNVDFRVKTLDRPLIGMSSNRSVYKFIKSQENRIIVKVTNSSQQSDKKNFFGANRSVKYEIEEAMMDISKLRHREVMSYNMMYFDNEPATMKKKFFLKRGSEKFSNSKTSEIEYIRSVTKPANIFEIPNFMLKRVFEDYESLGQKEFLDRYNFDSFIPVLPYED